MTAEPDRSACIAARRLLVSALLLLFGAGIFTGCEKTDDLGQAIGAVRRDGKLSYIRSGLQRLNEEKFEYFSLYIYHPRGVYPYGFITLYNLPLEIGGHFIEPRILDTVAHRYILDSVFCAYYYTTDVDAFGDKFRLIPDHPVNDFRITELNKTTGSIKGTFNLALERDPYKANLLPDHTHPDTVLFTEGSFKFNYKQ